MKTITRSHLRKDLFYTFDIETTTLITGLDEKNHPIRNAIIWSGQFYDGTEYIQTRSLADTIKRLKLIEEENIDNPYKVAIFVHNLSYEFQFIKDFFDFKQILCTTTRKIISAETDQIVFRCSYFLSNQSLDRFLKNENVPKEFRKTNMDYLVERFPWTPLTPEEEEYCANDVKGLHKALEHRISMVHNADINNLPLTSTGYVRKDCRKAVGSNKSNRYRFWNERLDKVLFKMCHAAFRGGNTHANRFLSNKYLKPPEGVGQKDERSAYPAALIFYDYPTKFTKMKTIKQKEFDYYLQNENKWAMIIKVAWKNIRLKDPKATPVPYLSTSKCNPLAFHKLKKGMKQKQKWHHSKQVDNGRVMAAKFLGTTITEQDYLIIREQYEWEEEKILDVRVAKKKPIPKELKEQILKYYYDKTALKQDDDDPNFDEDIAYNYARSKELLNGIYGMHVTNPCKSDFYFDDETHEIIESMRDEQELLDEYYNSFSSFLSYQVGVWCTSYARRMLQEGIDACYNPSTGYSDLIYCDTDSCKYLNPSLHEAAFKKINDERIALAEKRGAFIDFNGKRYHLGIFTDEPKAVSFKTWGAKKYIYSYIHNHKDGTSNLDFKITISGVPKAKGKKIIKKQLIEGKIKSFDDIDVGFVFRSVKTTSCYMDHRTLQEFEVDDKKVYYQSNVAMYPASYTLGLTAEYEMLLYLFEDYMNEEEINYDSD